MRRRIPLLTATFLVLALCGTARAVVSNSIIQDDIEYYIQVDKPTYDLGEEVQMLYKVTNLGDEDVTFGFPQSPEYNFWVDKNSDNIWRAYNGWYWFSPGIEILAGESKEFPVYDPYQIWNMRDSEDNLVNPGQYDVIGGLFSVSGGYEYTEVSVPITIVPEPSSLVLFTTGLFVLLRQN